MKKSISVRNMVQIAILGAIANVLTLIRFPLPFMPPFMDFDLAGVPEMIGVFIMGPVAGVLVVVVKILLKLLMSGTTSMFTGELQNLLLSCAYILPAWFVYNKIKTRKGALSGMIIGTIICSIVAVFTNLFIIIPFYAAIYGLSMDAIVSMTQAVNPLVDSLWKFVVLGIVPFNLIKGGVTSLVMYLMYPVLDRIKNKEASNAV